MKPTGRLWIPYNLLDQPAAHGEDEQIHSPEFRCDIPTQEVMHSQTHTCNQLGLWCQPIVQSYLLKAYLVSSETAGELFLWF